MRAIITVIIIALLFLAAPAATAAIKVRPGLSYRLTNEYRTEVCGLPPLAWDRDLSIGAKRWSKHMVRVDRLYHAPSATQIRYADSDWRRLAENVGYASNHRQMWRAFMASPGHRANVCDPRFTKIGIGVKRSDGLVWATYRFHD